MAYKWALWLADVLRDAGCPVVEEDGWRTRGRSGGTWEPSGIVLHHDASPPGETSHGVNVILNGRPGLSGPLSQLWLDFDGRWHIVAAGRANHAGLGKWSDIPANRGNEFLIGIETDHTTNEAWSLAQNRSGITGLIALSDRLGIRRDATTLRSRLIAHKEWAPDRKIDPDPLNMHDLRSVVLSGRNTTRPSEPGGADDTTEEGLFGMTDLKAFSTSDPQTIVGNGEWRGVRVGEDDVLTLVSGPTALYHVELGLTIARSERADTIATGDSVYVRLQAVNDYTGTKETVVTAGYPVTEVVVTSGNTYVNLSWLNALRETADAGTPKLRLFIQPPKGKSLVVSKVLARVVS